MHLVLRRYRLSIRVRERGGMNFVIRHGAHGNISKRPFTAIIEDFDDRPVR
jgi:hypothetical protein